MKKNNQAALMAVTEIAAEIVLLTWFSVPWSC